jgi:hypothetical protein
VSAERLTNCWAQSPEDITDVLSLDKFPYPKVAGWLKDGDVVPFLGAGASRAGVNGDHVPPDGKSLAVELISDMGERFPADSADLAEAAQYYASKAYDRSTLYDFLHKRFEQQQKQTEPGAVAKLLAQTTRGDRPLFLITTNYDSLIERAFAESGRPLCVITQNMRDPVNGATKVTLTLPDGSVEDDDAATFQWSDDRRFEPGCAYLFKMHGSVRKPNAGRADDVIITEDDYVDFMVNTGGRVSPFFPPNSLTAAYKRRRFLFLGYSLYDWNFRAFLRMLVIRNALAGGDALKHWAIQKAPSQLETDLWGARNVDVFDGELTKFCQSMEDACRT